MATSSTKRRQFWRADWFAGVLVVLAMLAPHSATGFLGTLERRHYDFASTSTSTARQPSDRVAVTGIDDQRIANTGRWSWPRDAHAQLIDQLANIVAFSLGKGPETRYQDGDRFAAELRAAMAQLPETTGRVEAAAAQSGAGSREKAVLAAAGDNHVFEETLVARFPPDFPAVNDDATDLKP